MAEMKYGQIAGIDKPVSRLAQGTIMVDVHSLEESLPLLDATFEGGVTLYDTAYIYGGGGNERGVGKWVNDRGIRDQIVMLAKGGHPPGGGGTVPPEQITRELNESLERLGFDYIDLYILHRDPQQPAGEIIDLLNEHKNAGKLHAFGGSNWTHERIREANEYAEANGLTPIAASSPHFSLAVQVKPVWTDCLGISGPDGADARAWYAEANLPLITWSSIARGFFSGKVTRDDDSILEECSRQGFCYPDNFDRLERAFQMAEQKGLTVAQVALAYVLDYPLNIFALVGPCTPDEFRENLAALDIELTPEELTWLEKGSDQ